MIKSNKTITELRILTFIPVVIIIVVFFLLIVDSMKQLQELRSLRKNSKNIEAISKLVTDLQQERGLSSGYLGSHGMKFGRKLADIRKRVYNNYQNLILNTKELLDTRKAIDELHITTIESFSYYTKMIKDLQKRYLFVVEKINDPYLVKQLHTYINLSFMKEALGEIRGSFNGIFSARNSPDRKLLYTVFHAKGMYDTSLERFYATAPKKFLTKLRAVTTSSEYKTMEHIIEHYALFEVKKVVQNPQKWFKISTVVINRIDEMEKSYISLINGYIGHKSHLIKLQVSMQLLILFVISTFILWLGYHLKNSIARNIALLEQYKDAVDRSSIVSKTDVSGRIIYANDKFCEISGYKKEELIGKPHRIVRHPDEPKSAFKQMWRTILAKKPWKGIVKNRKKDGGYYIVEATINPILNHKGEIEEFIAIRNDITQVIKLHEEIEQTQEDLIFRMGEIGETRSQETGFHVKRVAKYSELLGKLYGLDEKEVKYLATASPMHDIGKVGIPDTILKKRDRLTDEEWQIMKTHTDIGYALFKDSKRDLLKAAAVIAYEHHEKWDGSGYPRALKGEEIHIFGRITALADVFDALGSDRYYKQAWNDEKIIAYIKEERGRHFDPKLVDLFLEHLDEFLRIRDTFCDKSDFMKEQEGTDRME